MSWHKEVADLAAAPPPDQYRFRPMTDGCGVWCELCDAWVVEDEERFTEALEEVRDHQKRLH